MSIEITLMALIFLLGYFLITIETYIHVNKATIAMLMAIGCWIIQFHNPTFSHEHNSDFLCENLGNVSQVIFFLLAALTIVELINVHRGFELISKWIRCNSKKQVLWIFGFITFFLSAILDNLTTTVVMLSLLRKIIKGREDRLLIGGGIVIAANAGGVWSPIGDVTTTMLWIGGQVSAVALIKNLLIPSFVSMCTSFLLLSLSINGKIEEKTVDEEKGSLDSKAKIIFFLGLLILMLVPVFKSVTGLPPFMGMLFGLAILWLVTDILHRGDESKEHLKVPHVLTKIDLAGVLFFLGILLSVGALEVSGILLSVANFLDKSIGNVTLIGATLGIVSSIVDNVPLVAASMGMYDLVKYPIDDRLWLLIAYCAGTGGSLLLIGSAAGVVFMGIEKVDFMWYVRKITIPALAGYVLGIFTYFLTCFIC